MQDDVPEKAGGGAPLESDGGRNLVTRPEVEKEKEESRKGDKENKRKRENLEDDSKVTEKKRRLNQVEEPTKSKVNEGKNEVESRVKELKKVDSQRGKEI